MTKLGYYESLIIETSLHTNIYSKNAHADLPRHIKDSVTLGGLLDPQIPVVDFGSGCGLPAIPICLSYPDIQLTAIESKSKKTRFLNDVKTKIEIPNLTIIQSDIRIWAKTTPFKGTVIAKAFMPYPKLIQTLRLLPIFATQIWVPTSPAKWDEWAPILKKDALYTHALIQKDGYWYIRGTPLI